MATLSDFNGQASFTIGGNSFNNRASSGTPIYERTGGGGGSSIAGGFIDKFTFKVGLSSQTVHTFPDFDPSTQILLVGNHGDGENRDGAHALNEIPVVTVFGSSMPGLEIMMHAKIGVNSAGTIATHYTGTSSNAKWFTVLRFTRAGAGGSSSVPSGAVARAVYCGLPGSGSNPATFKDSSFNIDRVEASSGGFGDRIYFTNPIEDPIVIVPDFQPDYDDTPNNVGGIGPSGESQRITTTNPSYRLFFQDTNSNILLSLRFQGTGVDRFRHFVVF